jgi:hypothetical protein
MSLKLNGGWSYSTQQIENLIPHLKGESLKVLELGSGESTGKICDHFLSLFSDVVFHSFETSRKYLSNNPNVTSTLYETVESCVLPDDTFDLILVDGPYGEVRNQWYDKLRGVSRVGTIIHVDDFCHYASFAENLDKSFEYDILDESGRSKKNQHCWRTVKVTKIL